MKGNWFDEIPILSPEQAEKVMNIERQRKPKGFQHYRDFILRTLSSLPFSEKFKIIKEVDKDIIARFNTFQGTKAVHTLDYLHKIPSRKVNLTKTDEIVLLFRSINVIFARNDYYKKRRKLLIRLIK